MENRKRNIQMKFYVTEEEKRLIDEKMKQLPIKQYGAYFRKMAIDGYILVVDRSDTKAYIRELQAVSRNINQIAKRANATGTVYRQDIEDIKKAVDEIWRLQRRTLLRQHRRTRKRKGPAGRFHPAGHIYAIPSALQPH